MNPSNPEATAVAVRDGRILGASTVDELKGWDTYDLDDTFKDKVLVPAFVEAHTHVIEGALWAFPYVGYFDRRDLDGVLWKRSTSLQTSLERLRALETRITGGAEGDDPLFMQIKEADASVLELYVGVSPYSGVHKDGAIAASVSEPEGDSDPLYPLSSSLQDRQHP